MGQSKSIQELTKQGEEAKKFLKDLADDANAEYEFGKGELDKLKPQKYGSGTSDAVSIMFNHRADATVMSEWSLERIKTIIDATSGALFGKNDPNAEKVTPPPGLSGMANLELYIASQALSLISGILDAFKSTTGGETSRSSQYKDVGPGVTLFSWISEKTYQRHDIIANDYVAQNVYVFEAMFSAKEALSYSKLLDAGLYEDQKTALRKRLEALADKVANPATSDADAIKALQTSEVFQASLDAITAKIAQLDAASRSEVLSSIATNRARRLESMNRRFAVRA